MNALTVKSKLALKGEYTLIKRNGKTNKVVSIHKFDNLITDLGLDRLGTAPALPTIFLGTGTNAPSVSDTQMGAYLYFKDVTSTGSPPAPTSPDYFSTVFRIATFATGTATGNLTEVGVGWYSTNPVNTNHRVFSRARILDGVGSPTTLPVLADESLEVIYTLRVYRDLTDDTYNVTISGVTYGVTARVASAGNVAILPTAVAGGQYIAGVFDGAIAAVTSTPSGNQTAPDPYPTTTPYVDNSYELASAHLLPEAQGNLTGGIKSITTSANGFFSGKTQMQFSPNIPKDNTKKLTLNFKYSWARKP